MEIILGKVSAALPIANLVHGTVTCRVKRRKSGGRVIRQFSPEIMVVWRDDAVYLAEVRTSISVSGEDMLGTTGLEVSHAVQ